MVGGSSAADRSDANSSSSSASLISPAPKRRRRRGALDNSPRYADRDGASALGRRGDTGLDTSPEGKDGRGKKSTHALAKRWMEFHVPKPAKNLDTLLYAARRDAIAYVYAVVCGSPEPRFWEGSNGVIREIMVRLGMPDGSNGTVKRVLQDYTAAVAENVQYDPLNNVKMGQVVRVQKALLIQDGSICSRVVAEWMVRGVGLTQTTFEVNSSRRTRGLSEVSWSTIQNYVKNNPAFDLKKRETEGTGKKNPEETWSRARVAAVTELAQRRQYSLNPTSMGPSPGPPIDIFAILWSDEHHQTTRAGHASQYECRVARNAHGDVCAPSQGGVFPPKSKVQTQKFSILSSLGANPRAMGYTVYCLV